MDGYLRFGFGDMPDRLRGALDRVSEGLVHCGLRIADCGSGRIAGKAKG
jgi:hypothetical protein